MQVHLWLSNYTKKYQWHHTGYSQSWEQDYLGREARKEVVSYGRENGYADALTQPEDAAVWLEREVEERGGDEI